MTDVSGSSVAGSSVSGGSAKRAKAEAEKVRLEYVKKENELLKQKAEIEANINIVKQESKVAAAETEAKILESEECEGTLADAQPYENQQTDSAPQQLPSNLSPTAPAFQPQSTFMSNQPAVQQNTFQPSYFSPSNPPIQGALSDIRKYMLRRDALLSRFSKFDDTPESYATWRASFKSNALELCVSHFDEMALLITWLGPQTSKMAKRLRRSHAHDPKQGVEAIWERLEKRYGQPEMVEHSLKSKLNCFPTLTNKDTVKWYDLLDLLTEILSAMTNPVFHTLLSYFDSSSGVLPIVAKLPYALQEKWTTRASSYKRDKRVPFPPFTFFVNFIREICEIRNDPAFNHSSLNSIVRKPPMPVVVRKSKLTTKTVPRCPIHRAGHSLNECRGFRRRPLQDRQKFLREKKMKICFRCCESSEHISRDCSANVKCAVCNSKRHATAMHLDFAPRSLPPASSLETPARDNGGENADTTVNVNCTTLCGDSQISRSCGKIVLVDVYSVHDPHNVIRAYAIIDEQSNRTLASTDLFDRLGLQSKRNNYTLSSCSGSFMMSARHTQSICVRSFDGSSTFLLPDTIECDSIPSNLQEIATPDVVNAHPHLCHLSSELPALDPDAKVELLIGRDLPEVHHIHDQIRGGIGTPFAHKLAFGWVVVGEVCLGKVHYSREINVRKTQVLQDGRSTVFPLCEMNIKINDVKDDIFVRTPHDDKVALSIQDKQFNNLMEKTFQKDETGHWSAPLPFKEDKPPMPNNRTQAWQRAQILDASLRKNPKKQEHFVKFMSQVLDSGAAELAPSPTGESWYLPLFGVYHPRKPDKIRGVFDSSAIHQGISLNSVLMSGPDLTNSLMGILMRFRKNSVAITGDIEQMFYQFHVDKSDRNYLRFFWYQNNDCMKPLVEYRMTAHVFGNSPSPAIATYGLRKAVERCEDDVRNFVSNEFYVDDALASLTSESQAIDLMKRTQSALKNNGNIRLHKIVSNNVNVMKAFPTSDLVNDCKNLNFGSDALPMQRSLGLSWDINTDMFIFEVSDEEKPMTRRGLLSTMNSLFDSLGFLSPLVISGKILLREIIPPGTDWDEPLSIEHESKWKTWLENLRSICEFRIPRMIVPSSISLAHTTEVHIFSDASEQAISAVAYLRVIDHSGDVSVGFLMGKSKLAPIKGHTIPRLELCGAVLATELGETICEQLNLPFESCSYYTDSKVVLGYICNMSRRFFTYVSNRVERIHKVSKPSRWSYITTNQNQADIGTRYIKSPDREIIHSWIKGPDFLLTKSETETVTEVFPLIEPQNDKELRQEIETVVNKTVVKKTETVSYFIKFSKWRALVRALTFLRHMYPSNRTHHFFRLL